MPTEQTVKIAVRARDHRTWRGAGAARRAGGWTPHWKFARYDLKYLDDPKGVYDGAEQIHTIVRKGLREDMPEVYAVLDNFHWTPEQMAELMVLNQERRADPLKNAKRWMAENPEVVKTWTEGHAHD